MTDDRDPPAPPHPAPLEHPFTSGETTTGYPYDEPERRALERIQESDAPNGPDHERG